MAFCTNCGHKLTDGAKFCFECGAKVSESVLTHNENRRTVYDGVTHCCHNCGTVLKSFETHCPSCGNELRGLKASDSISSFTDQLKEIENSKRAPRTELGIAVKSMFADEFLDKYDSRKVELIKNFPIPNTIEDIKEFVILASSNLPTSCFESNGNDVQKTICDAWRIKLDQAYTKAKILFGDHEDFKYIEFIYYSKISEIERIKVKKEQKDKHDFAVGIFLILMMFIFLILLAVIAL